jgi:hypothetical protein
MNAIATPPARLALIIDGVTVRTVARADQAGVQTVMRDFYAAQSAGKQARILPIDDTAPAQIVEDDEDEDTVEVPRAVMAAALAQPVAAGTVSAVAVARIEQQEAWASAAGFALPSTLYAAGTRCIAVGDSNFIAERRRVAELPAFDDAAREVAARIRAENRSDVQAPMSALSMDPTGRIVLPDGRALTVTRSAFGQLAIRGGFGAGVRYLAGCCDPARRAVERVRRPREREPARRPADPQRGRDLRGRLAELRRRRRGSRPARRCARPGRCPGRSDLRRQQHARHRAVDARSGR